MGYRDSLRVAWLLVWRNAVASTVMGFVVGGLIGFVGYGISAGVLQLLVYLAVTPVSLFVVSPWVVRTMMRKGFNGFRLEIVRDDFH